MISIEEAFRLLDETVETLATEPVKLDGAVGRVLALPIVSDVNSPPHDKSVMDGFAVLSHDINNGKKQLDVIETVVAGEIPTQPLAPGQATQIMTGAPIPENADAVVMVEQTELNESVVTIQLDSIAKEKNILRCGVNFKLGQKVFDTRHVVRPTDIALLAEVGADTVTCFTNPTVAVLPTGNELVDCSETPGDGQIRNSNGPMLVAMARSLGLTVSDLGVGRDDADQLRELISKGLGHDILLLSGGVSAGTMDLIPSVLDGLGVKQVFHKVHVKPGKPIWFGVFQNNNKRTYVFGLPGNPVSSMVGFQLFVRAAIRKLSGGGLQNSGSVLGLLNSDHETRGNRPTFWPGKSLATDDEVRRFEPLIWRGSSDLFALGQSDGLIHFSADSSQHPAGEQVRFYPYA